MQKEKKWGNTKRRYERKKNRTKNKKTKYKKVSKK